MTQQKGYILFITFSMLALCTTLVSIFMVKGITHKKLSSVLLEQEKMHQFAISTISIAQSFLSFSAEDMKKLAGKPEEETPVTDVPKSADKDAKSADKDAPVDKPIDKPADKKDKPVDIGKVLLEKLLPVLGKTQEFKLSEIEKDSLLEIHLIFFAESGKININGLYDLVEKKFYDEGVESKDRKVFATWLFDKIASMTGKTSLLTPFVEHLKQRKAPFNDVTELLMIKEFAACFSDAIFYTQPVHAAAETKTKKLFLTDLFTVASQEDTIQPWLLSPSVCALLSITQKNDKNDKNDILEKKEEKIDLSSFKQKSNWDKDWDSGLKNIYGISYSQVPKAAQGLLATQFAATEFSVIASVFNDNMKVQIFAILKQKKLPDGAIVYDIIKIYQV